MAHPNKILSVFASKCPRCRTGSMFNQKRIFPLKTIMDMPTHCTSCGQKMELETGFYFGTGYVSYAISVAIMISFFVAYHVLIGISIQDNSILTCLFSGIAFLILLQPFIMRLSRTLYLSAFVTYDPDWKNNKA